MWQVKTRPRSPSTIRILRVLVHDLAVVPGQGTDSPGAASGPKINIEPCVRVGVDRLGRITSDRCCYSDRDANL